VEKTKGMEIQKLKEKSLGKTKNQDIEDESNNSPKNPFL